MSIFNTIGVKVKAEETVMVDLRAAQVTADEAVKDTKLAEIEADRLALHNATGAGFMVGERATKVAELSALRAAKLDEIAAIVSNADPSAIDSVFELITYLNANDADWISTLAAKKSSLDANLAAEIADAGDYAAFSGVWS